MIVGTVGFVALISQAAHVNFIVKWMILLFLPPMRALAAILVLAAINSVVLHKDFHLPVLALFFDILINMRLPPIVLPVMCVDTCIASVACVAVGAPNSLEVKHVEV
jgi:hypothetical protein